jgi:hypothetical protein
MGGSLPPIFWDGTGTGVIVKDAVPALSLNLPSPEASVDQARPAPARFADGPMPPEPKPVVLPPSMEAAIK